MCVCSVCVCVCVLCICVCVCVCVCSVCVRVCLRGSELFNLEMELARSRKTKAHIRVSPVGHHNRTPDTTAPRQVSPQDTLIPGTVNLDKVLSE